MDENSLLSELTITLPHTFSSMDELKKSYMPFTQGNTGLFIPTNEEFLLGQSVTLEIKLPKDTDVHQIDTKIVWMTPPGGSDVHATPGIGCQFEGVESEALRKKIETLIPNASKSQKQSYTL